jgi:arsenate reductase
MNIQIIGTKKSDLTRKTERFFNDRGVPYQFVDLTKRPLSQGELSNIASQTGAEALLDTESAAYRKRGLGYMEFDPLEEIAEDQSLLKIPIVRIDRKAFVGFQPELWERALKA